MTNLETDSFNKNYYCISQKALQNLEGERNQNQSDWAQVVRPSPRGEKIQDIWKDLRESCVESTMSNYIKESLQREVVRASCNFIGRGRKNYSTLTLLCKYPRQRSGQKELDPKKSKALAQINTTNERSDIAFFNILTRNHSNNPYDGFVLSLLKHRLRFGY